MRLLLLVESLVAGGAERQICTLAAAMKRRGCDVNVLTFRPGEFYRERLEEAGVPHRHVPTRGRLDRILSVRRALRKGRQDAVLAFTRSPCALAELAGFPYRRWGLVASERLAVPGADQQTWNVYFQLHRMADYVTANSHANRLQLERAVPSLAGRVITIYNAVDLAAFRPRREPFCSIRGLRLVVAASYTAKKNLTGLIDAVALLRRETPDLELHVDWYGKRIASTPDYDDALARIADSRLEDRFRLHPATPDIARQYLHADAVILPSYYEGLPNTICEAMACGRPILASAVCDAGNLVRQGENGFLFEPSSIRSIADAILDFAGLSPRERIAQGLRSREMAEGIFDVDRITDRYLEVLAASASGGRVKVAHWLPEVPGTAHAILNRECRAA